MKNKFILLNLLFFLLFGQALAQNTSKNDFNNQEVFKNEFPLTLSFRNDKHGVRDDYYNWEKAHLNFNSITKKYLKEEVDMPPIIAEWANRYSANHPEKLMLIHLNGEGRSVNDPVIQKLYFPGHWVYEEGTTPTTDIDKKQQTISLENAEGFSVKAYVVHGRNRSGERLPHDVMIIELDENGNRLWDKYEYATVKDVDYKNNTITLKRGMYNTKRRNFKKGSTYIAPVAGDFWGGNLMWYYNLSSSCPRDPNGKSAADIFVGEMKTWFGEKGPLKNIDGIGFDVNYFKVKQEPWDCNNDGKADQGIVDGKNIWREGDIDFLKKIRSAFGDDFIITADGWQDNMQRAVGILNGMETEGSCRYNDGYRQISRTINQHVYWNMHNTTKYKYSYITSKLRQPNDFKIATQLHRMGMGLSSCLGVAYAYSAPKFIPEAVGGDRNQINWLGKPIGQMRYTFSDSPDLLKEAGLNFDDSLIEKFNFKNADFKVSNKELHIIGKHKNKLKQLTVEGPEVILGQGDLIITFEAKALEGFQDLKADSLIPRKINVKIKGLPEFPAEPMNTHRLHNDLAGFMGMKDFTPQMFYFRNAGGSVEALKMIFEAEEQGAFAIQNLRVYNASCGIYREFENGIVLVNPALSPVEFDLKKIGQTPSKYRRLKATPPFDGILDGDLKEVMEYNNGLLLSDEPVAVTPLNALFLIKE